MNTEGMFDLVIVGGGAAGIMAAISARKNNQGLNVAIIDRTFALGRKILVCGAGRCNITNINLDKDITRRYYGADSSFLDSIFSKFGYKDIVKFFGELGIELYVERKTEIGKLFPVTNQAQTVTALLEDELARLGVKIFLNTDIKNITVSEAGFALEADTLDRNTVSGNKKFTAKKLIISAGGKTYPALGSNGSGYALASKLGHKVIAPVPSALPLEGKNAMSQQLQGIKMEIEATSIIEGKKIKSSVDDVMFTKYGLSGPAILNVSREISIRINREHKEDCYVALNFFPGQREEQVKQMFERRWQKRPDQQLQKSMYGIFPNKIPAVLLTIIGIDPLRKTGELTAAEKTKFFANLTDFRIRITATRGWNEAEFTAGGIDTTELKPATLESKLIPGLYFCGEIVNVDGDV